ncbi:MAG: B12-binding domain-containing radical SAM protein [Bacteroidales bacterium]|nr:B12-binding domain-containing radical SAM protein [Bacteroidales bacterium]
MRVLLIYPNITDYPIDISFGLASLSAFLKKLNHQVELTDLTFNRDFSVIDEKIEVFRPEIIGIPVASNDFHFCLQITGHLKEKYTLPIVAGGFHASMAPEDLMADPSIDFAVVGEGEIPFSQIIDYLSSGEDPAGLKKIKSIYYRGNGRVVHTPLGELNYHPEKWPFPDRRLFDYQRYINLNRGLATFISSYGCPYACTYCINKAMVEKFGMKGFIRFKPISYFLEEIKSVLKEFAVRELEFYDDTFTLDRKRLQEFCERYPREIGLPFYINSRVDSIHDNEYPLLRKAGCKRISFGIECGDPEIRNEVLKRNQSDEQIIKAFRLARENGIQTLSYNMVGIPYETRESIRKTILLNRKCKPDFVAVSLFNAYKGTEIYSHCLKKGWLLEEHGQSYFQTSNIAHPNFSLKQLKRIRDRFGYEVFKKMSYKRALIDLIDKQMIENRIYQQIRSFLIRKGIKNYL